MKVKLKKHKKSPAPRLTEQVQIKSTIETLRNTHTYGVPIHVIYDRGYQRITDLSDKIQETEEKIPAPIAAKQAASIKAHKWFHRMSSEEMQEMIKSRNQNIKLEYIQQIVTIAFYSIIALLFAILILKKLF